ncbi:MAG: DUF1415 domain-containing protein [Cyanobacteria bacterium P01_F01_bin.150]
MELNIERSRIVQEVEQWLKQVVVGLKLCPFAAEPLLNQRVRIWVSTAKTEEALLTDLQSELTLLDQVHSDELETSILVAPLMLTDFEMYNEFLYLVNLLLQEFDWERLYQVASFHPHYCFAGVEPEATENLTNRSPYPLLHILREKSVSEALASFEQPEMIPIRNIKTVENLTSKKKQQLFPYLYP